MEHSVCDDFKNRDLSKREKQFRESERQMKKEVEVVYPEKEASIETHLLRELETGYIARSIRF